MAGIPALNDWQAWQRVAVDEGAYPHSSASTNLPARRAPDFRVDGHAEGLTKVRDQPSIAVMASEHEQGSRSEQQPGEKMPNWGRQLHTWAALQR